MANDDKQGVAVSWAPTWNPAAQGAGLEHLLLSPGSADGVVLAVDDAQGPFRLVYRLQWDAANWRLRSAELSVRIGPGAGNRSLQLRTDGQGHWQDGQGKALGELDGCLDIDIWPTPFTNSFPIRRQPLRLGERREFLVAWVDGVDLGAVKPQRQAYTRLAERRYLFESLDGSGFSAELPVDAHGLVLDYPGLFRRVPI